MHPNQCFRPAVLSAPVFRTAALLAALCLAMSASALMDYRPRLRPAARLAISEDPTQAKRSIDALRAHGPDGLETLMEEYGPDIQRRLAQPAGRFTPDEEARWKRISAAIDTVAAQKDAHASGLYWYTDLEQARAASRASGRPILSLRLLGTLDTDFSCANSRFFRTVLYPNAEVSRTLRDRYVLHWQSVRPVPKVTIDMGDGRVIQRTITGNSIHYVLDSAGRPVDAIPGLYGPGAFLRALGEAGRAVAKLNELPDDSARRDYLADWHVARLAAVDAAWERDLSQINGGAPTRAVARQSRGATARKGSPTAAEAATRATAKSAAEVPIVRALDRGALTLRPAAADEATWSRIAALPAHAADARLDPSSRSLVVSKGPPAATAAPLTVTKLRVEDPMVRLFASLQRNVAEDTVRNEYTFHRTIHEWFATRQPETLESTADRLNERVYADLFLTPSTDPWLGLAPRDAYSALDGDGIKASVR